MKKLIIGLVVLFAWVVALIWILNSGPHSSKFAVGPPLPPGKVAPQLVSTWDTAVLLAPDGSLWCWGGSEFGLQGMLPAPGVFFTTPARRHQYQLAESFLQLDAFRGFEK